MQLATSSPLVPMRDERLVSVGLCHPGNINFCSVGLSKRVALLTRGGWLAECCLQRCEIALERKARLCSTALQDRCPPAWVLSAPNNPACNNASNICNKCVLNLYCRCGFQESYVTLAGVHPVKCVPHLFLCYNRRTGYVFQQHKGQTL